MQVRIQSFSIFRVNAWFREEVLNKMHVVLISATYFQRPVAYDCEFKVASPNITFRNYTANTMVLLLNTETTIQRPIEFVCWSENSTHKLSEKAYHVRIAPGIWLCKWTQYTAICPVAENLTVFSLSEISLPTNSTPVEVNAGHKSPRQCSQTN